MIEDLYRQIDEAEKQMRDSTQSLGRLQEVRTRMADAVGRGEADGGHIVVEYTTAGLSELTINPRAMRLPSTELAEAIKEALAAAVKDFRTQSMQALRDAGMAQAEGGERPDIGQLQAQLTQARERYTGAMRGAARQLDEASRLRRSGTQPG